MIIVLVFLWLQRNVCHKRAKRTERQFDIALWTVDRIILVFP
jgi:hypothetical protein